MYFVTTELAPEIAHFVTRYADSVSAYYAQGCPLQKANKSKIEADVERLKVKLMWDVYWKWVAEVERGEIENEQLGAF